MTKRHESWLERKKHQSKDGLEFYNYPGVLAQKYWYHVHSLGQAVIGPGYRCRPEARGGFLLHYVKRGTVRHHTCGENWDVRAGSICLMDRSEENEHRNMTRGDAELWWMVLDGRDIPHLATELRADREPVFLGVDAGRFEALFLELLRLTQMQPRAYEARSSAVIAGILAELFAVREEQGTQVSLVGETAVLSPAVRKGIDYMTRFYGNPGLDLASISAAAGLSLRHFMRLFRGEVGMTPMQYLNRYRVQQAERLLLTSNRTMEEVARLVGTSSQSYFAHLFRKHKGVSPRKFRERAGKK